MTLLQLDHIGFNLQGNTLLSDINLTIAKQDFIVLLGSNGSGKSTLLKLISGIYKAQTGKIKLSDKSLHSYSSKQLSEQISLLSQNYYASCFATLTVYENYLLRQNKFFIQHKKERTFLKTFLAEYNVNLSKKLDVPVQQLSGGEAQAFVLALCFLNTPNLLLLDENTSALDPKTSEYLMDLTQRKIKEYQITCILTTHNLDTALRYGNRIIFLQNGKLHKVINTEEKNNLIRDDLLLHYSDLNASIGSNFDAK